MHVCMHDVHVCVYVYVCSMYSMYVCVHACGIHVYTHLAVTGIEKKHYSTVSGLIRLVIIIFIEITLDFYE